jgi:hypothetical protein
VGPAPSPPGNRPLRRGRVEPGIGIASAIAPRFLETLREI